MKTPDGREITDQLLCEVAPHLFADRHAPMQTTCMCWGFEIGPGWMGIIYEAALKLEPLIVAAIVKNPEGWEYGYYRASQIKEKYGTLRFYLSGGTDEMYAITDEAEKKSTKTCENCGKPGKLRGKGWYYTRCMPCWKKEQE